VMRRNVSIFSMVIVAVLSGHIVYARADTLPFSLGWKQMQSVGTREFMGLLQTNLVEKALRSPWVITLLKRIVPPLDKFLLRFSRGWVSTAMQSIAMIECTGAKSGLKREIVTLCMADGKDILLVGSNWGLDRHPAWLINLRAYPIAKVTFRGYRGPMRARELSGDERAEAWARLIVVNPQYARYQTWTDRVLPVVRLQR
ncbi:MAG: nitroreductase family deazaflavin-dependent oxidoreductase, partial [Halioglobus sp.]